jgi:glucose-1-phosphate thymidylyltransferase
LQRIGPNTDLIRSQNWQSMYKNENEVFEPQVIGLIPAAGLASRLSPLPCSKELFPIGFGASNRGHNLIPKVACHYLLEKMRLAGILEAYIILRKGKWDIPAYFGNGSILDMHLAYLMMGLPFGVPYTLDQAYPFVQDAITALGFPDILFEADDAFHRLLAYQAAKKIDVAMGLFPCKQSRKADMVALADDGRVERVVIKPRETNLIYSWAIAVWTPVFSRFMHEYLSAIEEKAAHQSELFMGDVFNAAIREGLKVKGVLVSDKPFLDIGTDDELREAAKRGLDQVDW